MKGEECREYDNKKVFEYNRNNMTYITAMPSNEINVIRPCNVIRLTRKKSGKNIYN